MRVLFPHSAKPRVSAPRLVGMSLDPQPGLTGAQTVVPTLRARWEIDVTFGIHGEAAILAWQAFVAQMEGRIGTTLVPVFTPWRPRDRDGHQVPFRRGAGFSDGQTAEHFGFGATPAVTATLTGPAALRATEIGIALGNTTGIRPGQFFSIGERLYRARLVWQQGGETRVLFQPPLRDAAEAGTVVVLDKVACLMRSATEIDPELVYRPGPFHEPTVQFLEAI